MQRKKAAHFNGGKTVAGASLRGFTARCGSHMDSDQHKVLAGCGTALADIHYTCAHCEASQADDPNDDNEGSVFSLVFPLILV